MSSKHASAPVMERVIVLARRTVASEYHVITADLPAERVGEVTTEALANGWTDVLVAQEVMA